MPVRDVVIYGHPALRIPAQPVTEITPEILSIIKDLKDTLAAQKGIGLAAPQIGVQKQIFIADLSSMNDRKYAACKGVFINPEIIFSSKTMEGENEGCLSFPDMRGDVQRPFKIRMRAMMPSGAFRTIEATGLYARCLQHEFDHLHGKLFIDYFNPQDAERTKSECVRFLEESKKIYPETLS
ncbi:MAG: peptide deformylase [Brevinema sp.]